MINQILQKITDNVQFEKRSQIIGYLNVYNYQILRRNRESVAKMDSFTLDGILLLMFIRLFMGKKYKRMSPDFSSYFDSLFKYLESFEKKVVFIGGLEKDMLSFKKIIQSNYPKMNVVETYNGFELEETAVIDNLISNKIDYIIVGMGSPKQEKFMITARERGYLGNSFCCGAFISQTATKGKVYYPKLVNQFHLRWAYRIYKDPKLYKRYLFRYPKGLALLFWDRYFKT